MVSTQAETEARRRLALLRLRHQELPRQDSPSASASGPNVLLSETTPSTAAWHARLSTFITHGLRREKSEHTMLSKG